MAIHQRATNKPSSKLTVIGKRKSFQTTNSNSSASDHISVHIRSTLDYLKGNTFRLVNPPVTLTTAVFQFSLSYWNAAVVRSQRVFS